MPGQTHGQDAPAASFAIVALLSVDNADAADSSIPFYTEAPVNSSFTSRSDWSGFYVGAHAGVARAHAPWLATQPGGAPNITGALDLFEAYNPFDGSGSHFAGLAVGYNYMMPSRIVIGAEADISFPSTFSAVQGLTTPVIGSATYSDRVEMFGSARGRVGYDINHWLYYVTGGLAWTHDQFSRTTINPGTFGGPQAGTSELIFGDRIGWTIGAGAETPVAPGWSVKAEYLYAQFGNRDISFPLGSQVFTSDLAVQELRVGLNYRPGDDPKSSGVPIGISPLAVDGWSIHGQTTYVTQYAPPFHAPYSGGNSLESNAGRESWDATLYVGRRLWEGAELWIDPEIDQGFGLTNTLGVAGFPSGEAYKVGSTYPYFRLPRYFIRQTINLGEGTRKVEDDINQFSATQAANRS